MEEAIFSRIHDHRFYLPEQALVCQGTMRGKFGYQANMLAERQVLSGNYNFTEGFDKATRELMEECARVRSLIPARSVNINLNRQG